jgi:hypothetical protein
MRRELELLLGSPTPTLDRLSAWVVMGVAVRRLSSVTVADHWPWAEAMLAAGVRVASSHGERSTTAADKVGQPHPLADERSPPPPSPRT